MDVFTWLDKKGIKYRDKDLIIEALTHSSYINENKKFKHHNERLEFVGDAVLQIWVSERLFKLDPPLSEGKMSSMRQQLVCEDALASLMRQLGLGEFMLLGAGEEKSGGRNRNSLLADGFEAFIGALYLDTGMKSVDKILNEVMLPMIRHPEEAAFTDYKTPLQEYVQSDIRGNLNYRLLSEKGPTNDPVFEIGVFLDGVLLGKGIGSSKKRAEQQAAKQALEKLVK
ncbi:MAG: ribonuclease III [Erysipelotrichaceae bacterium]|nr:ribonuclease III [Erysipelotrichaceae bacterium]